LNSDFKDYLAKVISTLFVPPSFTILVFTWFAFLLETKTEKSILLIITALTFGFLFHILFFFYLRKKGRITDSDASIKEERTFPFIVSVFFYTAGLIILYLSDINIISTAFWFCYISNTVLIMLINKHWKISVHAMGASGPMAALFYAFGPVSLFLLPLIFFIGWARIHRRVHSLSQVITGALIGFISTYLQMYFIINYLEK